MAILKGFPPSNLIGPGVRIAEKDLSFIAPEQSGHRGGLVGFASKGPINIPTLITTSRQLHTVFGQPHPQTGDPYLLYAAEAYLQVANELFVVRVGETSPTNDEQAKTASVSVLTAGGPVQIEGNVAAGAGWSFTEDTFFRWRLNGILSSKVLVILSDDNRPSPDTGNPYDPQDLVDELNAQLSPEIDGIEFYLNGEDTTALLGVQTTFSYGAAASLELVSVKDALYGPSSVVGVGTLMTTAVITGTLTQYPPTSIPTPGTYDFSGFTADTLNLQIVVDGTDNILIDNIVQTVAITSASQSLATIVSAINQQITDGDIPGGFEAVASSNSLRLQTLHHGRDAKLLVKSDSTADALFGLANTTASGTSPSCVTSPGATYTCGIVTGDANDDGTVCFTVAADSPGIDGNNTQLVITNSVDDGTFSIEVYSYGNQVESWGPLTKDTASSFYVESYISAVSDFIRVTDNTDTLALPAAASSAAALSLSGGTDGIPADPDDQDTQLLGSDVSMTGLQALSDPEQVDIDLIAIPGHTSTTVVQGLLDFCQTTRADCFAIVDSPFGLSVTEVVQWQNGIHPLNETRFDSDFGALYWPWIKIRDTFNRIDVWVPPSGHVMAAYARSDAIGAPWFAPAGLSRGVVPGVLDVFSRPSLAERDSMYGNRNAVNPIIQFVDVDGFLLWGQKTLQRTPTALDRVNVRRMLLYIEKRIKADTRNLLFEPHDQNLRDQFVDLAEVTLKQVLSNRGISDYIVKCDAELNTPDVIDRNELRARIGVQPTKAAEYIFIEFSIHRTGSFGESTEF